MNYEESWEILAELGAGGQGKVYEVVRKLDLLAYESEVIHSLEGVTSMAPSQKQREHIKTFKNNFAKLLELDKPENHGALKVLHNPNKARDFQFAKQRLEKEVSIMAENLHPNLLKIIDYDKEYDWYVSRFYKDGSLDGNPDLYKGNLYETLLAIRPIIEAVAVLHKKGYVHRDIKPHKIFTDNNNLILGDFGLIYFSDPDKTRISQTFENIGSRDWMPGWAYSLRIEDVKPSFDVFSLGKVIWSLLSGEPVLPLWYFKRNEFNVEQLFPHSTHMKLANELFEKCIVELEQDCLKDTHALLEEIDKTISIIVVGGEPLDLELKRRCKVCGVGSYQIQADENHTETVNYGFNPAGTRRMKIFECDYCGHVQLFSFKGSTPKAW